MDTWWQLVVIGSNAAKAFIFLLRHWHWLVAVSDSTMYAAKSVYAAESCY